MIVIAVDRQTENVLAGTNLTKLNTNDGLRYILKTARRRPPKRKFAQAVDKVGVTVPKTIGNANPYPFFATDRLSTITEQEKDNLVW